MLKAIPVQSYIHLNKLFTDHLARFTLSLKKAKPPELYQPCDYILSLGGKRLRPLLALIACELFEKKPEQALDAALAVELFHNFSLIHDDILDEAPLRRNQPTVHLKWNRNIAILSGDALLVKSLEVINNYPPEQAIILNKLFCKTALQVCEGQQLDMNFETREEVSIPEYISMIQNKTAVLLACSLQMGAITAGASPESQKHLYNFGIHLGIAFQLLDDLLDAFAAKPDEFGKQPGGDILANKKTYLLLKALELSGPDQKLRIRELIQDINIPETQKVLEMINLFRTLHVDQYCSDEAKRYTLLALEDLEKCGASSSKREQLHVFSEQLLRRNV